MYCFHLDNKFSKVIAIIEYSEEQALNALYEKDIPFIKKLWERYYDDCIFSVAELSNAQRDLAQYMDLERWDNHQEKEIKEQILNEKKNKGEIDLKTYFLQKKEIKTEKDAFALENGLKL